MRPLPPAASAAKIVARYKRVGERSGWAAEHNNTLRTIYEAIIQPGDTVVDGGAHVGTHTIPMARAVGPTGRVIACEPLDEARQRLLAALASERLTEPTLATRVLTRRRQHQSEPKPSPRSIAALGIVEVHGKALTDHVGDTVEFLYFPERPGISGMRRHLLGTELAAETRSTTTTTIDELVGDDDVRFIKLDVEGAELMALRGAERVVRRSKPTVHLEAGFAGWSVYGVGGGDLAAWCDDHGYACFDAVGTPMTDAASLVKSFSTPNVWDYAMVHRAGSDWDRVLETLAAVAAEFQL